MDPGLMDDGRTATDLPGRSTARCAMATLSGRSGGVLVVVTIVLAGTAAALVDDAGSRWTLIASSPLAAAAAANDARTRRIPRWLAGACSAVALIACVVAAIVDRSWEPLLTGLSAGAAVGVVFLALWRFTGLGMGDVRLATALAPIAGLAGWQTVVAFVVLTHLLATPLAVWALARRRRDIPFGLAIVAGLYLAVALAPML